MTPLLLLMAVAGGKVVAPAVPLTPCVLSHPAGARAYASCGEVAVAIDPAHPEKTIGIGFAVLPATGTAARLDPIVFLAGGPGQAATRDYVGLLPSLASLHANHDFVLVDIRGTGRSVPQSCKDVRPVAERIRAQNDVDEAAACAATMTLDPVFITTADAARDVEAVRVALRTEKWNVVGISYGTRLAILYDQLFAGRARTLTIDGVAPLDRALGDDISADMSAALRAAGAPATGAGRQGDDVINALFALKAALKANPQMVKVPHPTTGKILEVSVNAEVINATVRMLLYADETRSLVAMLLKNALGSTDVVPDLTPLVALAISVAEQLEGSIHGPVSASILCAEDAPYLSDEPQPVDAVFDDERPFIRALCSKWPHARVAQPRMQPTQTPTLLLSGEFDPVTPPRHAQRIEGQFADHFHLIIPGLGHSILARGCVADIVADFIGAGTAQHLDTSCAKKIGPAPVFVDSLGPAP